MKITFEVPKGFLGCGLTMVYEDESGLNMYSTSVTPEDIDGDKVVKLPKEVKQNDAE